jgi:hypothetical protein
VKLGELQALLARAIEAPDTVEPGLLERSIAERTPLEAAARANIYAEMYRFRLADALRADFPRLARLLGDEGFFAMAQAYATEHPSASSDIGQFGRHLADFLAENPGPRGDESDLARLEWALAQASGPGSTRRTKTKSCRKWKRRPSEWPSGGRASRCCTAP